jgi:hypothetical protein
VDRSGVELLAQGARDARNKSGIVVKRRRGIGAYAHLDRGVGVQARRHGLGAGDALDALQQFFARGVRKRADSQLHVHFVGNDIVLEAAIERANCHNACVIGRDFARDQRLQRRDDAGGRYNGVLRVLRIGAMPADAGHLDVDAVDIRHDIAGTDAKLSGGKRAPTASTAASPPRLDCATSAA